MVRKDAERAKGGEAKQMKTITYEEIEKKAGVFFSLADGNRRRL
jgi:hypothetical protein